MDVPLRNQAIQNADMPLIGMSGVPQVRVDVVGRAMQLVQVITQIFMQFKNNYCIRQLHPASPCAIT